MTQKPRVLFVDDNVNLLNAIKRVLRKNAELVTAESGAEALKILEAEPEFAVLVSDQNMPNMKGEALLAEAAKRWPLTVRVMLTGNDDQTTAISAVNTGQVFRFVRKPCEPEMLIEVITAAAAHHYMINSEKQLLEKTLAGSVKVLSDVLATLRPDLFQRATKIRKMARLVAVYMRLPRAWELDIAAMLYPLGMAAIPEAVAHKYARGETISLAEQKMIDQSTQVASSLISNIPRLENIAEGICLCRKGFDGSGFPEGGGKGISIPQISRILRILIDMVDATVSGHASPGSAGKYLQKNARFYDPELLKIIIEAVETSPGTSQIKTYTDITVPPGQLRAGDMILKDILDKSGKLLLAAGAEVSELTIQRLDNFAKSVGISDQISISRASA